MLPLMMTLSQPSNFVSQIIKIRGTHPGIIQRAGRVPQMFDAQSQAVRFALRRDPSN